MPFTLAHPAAVLPLRNRLPRILPWSALVIGSMTPDFRYFLLDFSRENSHSLPGLFRFCLPVGIVAWLLFHLLMKRPLTLLLPRADATRLWPLASTPARISVNSILAVALAILVGSSTHVIWDAFTHGNGWAVTTISMLSRTVVSVHGYQLTVFRLLQHGSTIVGMALLLQAYLQWRRHAEPADAPVISRGRRWLAVALVIALPCLAALAYAAAGPIAVTNLETLRPFVWRFVTAGIGCGITALVLYSLAVTFVMARSATTPR